MLLYSTNAAPEPPASDIPASDLINDGEQISEKI